MKRIISLVLLSVLSMAIFAQGDYEAYRFTQSEYSGTARYMGAGGAFTATGGEFSALSLNPAAIGLFKRHEVSFTFMSLTFPKNITSYYNNTSLTKNPKYTVPQCGIVVASNISNSDWKYWQFGFGYNRVMDYNNIFRADATNINSSMVNTILSHAQGIPFGQLGGDASLAWSTWLMDTMPGTNNYYYSPFENANVDQASLIEQSGAIDEISITIGGNYNDKLYIGAGLGIPILNYKEKIDYIEAITDLDEYPSNISSFKTSSIQQDKGAGINAKLGIIYQPIDFLRLGLGFQTPTYFWKIKDIYSRDMISYYTNGDNSGIWSYTNKNQFTLTTPLKFNVSASFIIQKRAFIALEYDFCHYGMANLFSNNYNYAAENELVNDKFGICHTLRLGTEVNLTSHLALRAGYNYKSSPYKLTPAPYNASAHSGSIGLGFKSKYLFADLAYVIRFSKDSFWLYDDYMTNPAEVSNTTHRIVATIGCKF